METEKLQKLSAYRTAMILFKRLLNDGTLSEKEYNRLESIVAEKCGLSLYSIYRETA